MQTQFILTKVDRAADQVTDTRRGVRPVTFGAFSATGTRSAMNLAGRAGRKEVNDRCILAHQPGAVVIFFSAVPVHRSIVFYG